MRACTLDVLSRSASAIRRRRNSHRVGIRDECGPPQAASVLSARRRHCQRNCIVSGVMHARRVRAGHSRWWNTLADREARCTLRRRLISGSSTSARWSDLTFGEPAFFDAHGERKRRCRMRLPTSVCRPLGEIENQERRPGSRCSRYLTLHRQVDARHSRGDSGFVPRYRYRNNPSGPKASSYGRSSPSTTGTVVMLSGICWGVTSSEDALRSEQWHALSLIQKPCFEHPPRKDAVCAESCLIFQEPERCQADNCVDLHAWAAFVRSRHPTSAVWRTRGRTRTSNTSRSGQLLIRLGIQPTR